MRGGQRRCSARRHIREMYLPSWQDAEASEIWSNGVAESFLLSPCLYLTRIRIDEVEISNHMHRPLSDVAASHFNLGAWMLLFPLHVLESCNRLFTFGNKANSGFFSTIYMLCLFPAPSFVVVRILARTDIAHPKPHILWKHVLRALFGPPNARAPDQQ